METTNTNKKIVLHYLGEDSWNRPTFKVNDAELYVKDINLSSNIAGMCLHWSCPKDDPEGEPDYPFKPKDGVEVEILDFNEVSEENKFNYQMLSRLQQDCEYYLGWGSRNTKGLYYHDVKEQIQAMKNLWNGFANDCKPQWLTMEQIEEYEKAMTETPAKQTDENEDLKANVNKTRDKPKNGLYYLVGLSWMQLLNSYGYTWNSGDTVGSGNLLERICEESEKKDGKEYAHVISVDFNKKTIGAVPVEIYAKGSPTANQKKLDEILASCRSFEELEKDVEAAL